MHTHCTRIASRVAMEDEEGAKGANLCDFPRRYKKVPVRNLALHVMPRQRLYPDDLGQITVFAWSLAGIS